MIEELLSKQLVEKKWGHGLGTEAADPANGASLLPFAGLRLGKAGGAGWKPDAKPYAILKLMAVANPKSVKVNISTGAGVDIEWNDGHRTHYNFQWLRDACPCATCTEERNSHSRKAGEPVKQASSLLPMYKEPAKPTEAKAVGRYALNFHWNDGHSSGIYSWDYLREMCQCEECKKSGDRRDRVHAKRN